MLPVQITMKDIPLTPTIENKIRKKAEKLTRLYDRIISCRVVVESPQRHKHRGKLFKIRIDLSVPGKELIVNHKQNENAYAAIRDAFKAMERQLEEFSRKQHGHVKSHQDVMHGYVTKMLVDQGYGFIEGMDGNEYYFSMTNVGHPAFTQLEIGDAVQYTPEFQGEGMHAHHVIREKRHHEMYI